MTRFKKITLDNYWYEFPAIGFELEQYTLDEQTDAYQLMVKVLSPAASLHSNVTVQVTAVHANSTGRLFTYSLESNVSLVFLQMLTFLSRVVLSHSLQAAHKLLSS